MPKWTTERAFALLRPLLKDIKVQHVPQEPFRVQLSKRQEFITADMGSWVIVIRQYPLPHETPGSAVVGLGKGKSRNFFYC